MSVFLPKNIDVNKIKYSEVKVLKSGAKSIYMNYEGSKLMLQTPVLSLPYGVNDNSNFINKDKKDKKDDKPDDKKYDLTLSFKGIAENPKIKAFHDKIKEMEEKIIEDAFTNRQLWFKNNFNNNKDVVTTMFTPMIKLDKDKETGEIANKYPPTFKVKIPYDPIEDKFGFDAYDMDNKELDFTTILNNLKGGKAQLIIQLNGIWFAGGMFGCSWRIVSGKFQQSNISKVVFVADSDDDVVESDEEDDISVDEEVIKKTSNKRENTPPPEEEDDDEQDEDNVDNDEPDEEHDEEPEVERPPSPPPKVVAKKAVKKTTK